MPKKAKKYQNFVNRTALNYTLKILTYMNYLIQAFQNDRELLGTSNASLVRNAKSMVKVNNALKRFNPDKVTTIVKVFSYTNLYNESTYKLVKTVSFPF